MGPLRTAKPHMHTQAPAAMSGAEHQLHAYACMRPLQVFNLNTTRGLLVATAVLLTIGRAGAYVIEFVWRRGGLELGEWLCCRRFCIGIPLGC